MGKADRLAVEGGHAVRHVPYPSWPVYDDDEVMAATSVLRSGRVNYWTGEEGHIFEKEFASYVGTGYAVAMANGTVALDSAFRALGIGAGDEVVVTPRTFIASASAFILLGAIPVFADVDPDSQNITAETMARVVTPRTKAVLAVHHAGWPCEMDPIMDMARDRCLWVVEDSAHAHGALYRGRKTGSFGDVAAFSFCQDKIMTTAGEGGMVTTGKEEIWSAVWSFKDHGKSFWPAHEKHHPPVFRWLHDSFGSNYRMTELQAAIGRIQLKKLDGWLGKRERNARYLSDRLAHVPGLRVVVPPPHVRHSYYKYYVFLIPEMLKDSWDQERIITSVTAEGVPCFSGTCGEIYMEKAFIDTGLVPRDRLPVAERLSETSLMFPVHPTLETDDLQDTVMAVEKVMRHAVRA
ncbi:MAG: DegT/DnrJ/EryC1/StrS aminotransferase family protein [Syntrophaceae bacterium]|nr:DegT/DnrJ/EryC1/StrS aminotransferase family protein [Syntrophaceae bacterium]